MVGHLLWRTAVEGFIGVGCGAIAQGILGFPYLWWIAGLLGVFQCLTREILFKGDKGDRR